MKFWSDMIPSNIRAKFFSIGLQDWLAWNLNTKDIKAPLGTWAIFFGLTVYHLWLDRTKLVFTQQSTLSLGFL